MSFLFFFLLSEKILTKNPDCKNAKKNLWVLKEGEKRQIDGAEVVNLSHHWLSKISLRSLKESHKKVAIWSGHWSSTQSISNSK